jgi:hypothetical protein
MDFDNKQQATKNYGQLNFFLSLSYLLVLQKTNVHRDYRLMISFSFSPTQRTKLQNKYNVLFRRKTKWKIMMRNSQILNY